MATLLAPWLIVDAAGISFSLLGENLQRNVRLIFKEERTTELKFERSSAHKHSLDSFLLSWLAKIGQSLLPSPIIGVAPASTVYTHKHMICRCRQRPDIQLGGC